MTTQQVRLVAIVGSLRARSISAAALRAATAYTPDPVLLERIELSEVPLYNGDIEERGEPAAVAALKHAVGDADGLVIFTPEYNHSVPAVTKNAVDWLSRPHGHSVLAQTPVGIVSVTPGFSDGSGVRDHLGIAVAANSRLLFPESLSVAGVGRDLDEAGELSDRNAIEMLTDWVGRFADFIAESNGNTAAA